MLATSEINTAVLVRALRIYVNDLTDRASPFTKGDDYLRDLAGWLACAATRLEKLESQKESK
jgi:hypothetical protein